MRILLTNDDGVNAPGLSSAAAALKDVGEVTVVAPDRDLSGVSSAMTLLSVLRVHELQPLCEGVKTFSVEGTPADCVVLATETLSEKPFDLVVSGINQGSNLGLDVMLSGTLGGAFQGYFRNISSIAVSVASLTDVRYEAAALTAKSLAEALRSTPPESPLLLNVNLPNLEPDRIKGLERTSVGPRAFLESVDKGHDGRRTHYWIKRNRPVNPSAPQGTDIWAVRNDRISVSHMELAFTQGKESSAFDDIVNYASAALDLDGRR